VRWKARAFFALLIGFLFGINGLNVITSYVARDFMTAVEHRDRADFVWQATLYVGVFMTSTLAALLYRFSEERLALLWREWLAQRLLKRYLAQRTYLRLEARNQLANPDQRIADDTRAFTATTLSFMLMYITPLSPRSRLPGFCGPSAESVALLHREGGLATRLLGHVEALTTNLRRIIAVNRDLAFFTTGYNYMIQLIPALIIGHGVNPISEQNNGRAQWGIR
jgi:putative ATP-binding cassette transporter